MIRRKILRMNDLEKNFLGKIHQRILDKFKIDVTRIHLFTIDIYFRKFLKKFGLSTPQEKCVFILKKLFKYNSLMSNIIN